MIQFSITLVMMVIASAVTWYLTARKADEAAADLVKRLDELNKALADKTVELQEALKNVYKTNKLYNELCDDIDDKTKALSESIEREKIAQGVITSKRQEIDSLNNDIAECSRLHNDLIEENKALKLEIATYHSQHSVAPEGSADAEFVTDAEVLSEDGAPKVDGTVACGLAAILSAAIADSHNAKTVESDAKVMNSADTVNGGVNESASEEASAPTEAPEAPTATKPKRAPRKTTKK